MTENIIEAVLKNEASPSRFESFCRELVEASEGITLVPTSYNYDQGRDARSIGPSNGSHGIVLCVTTDADPDDKVTHDATLLAKTSQPDHVYYCYSKRLTEYKIDALSASLRAAFSSPPGVTFLALQQLIPMAARHSPILEKHYKSDLQSIDATLHRLETGAERNDAGLRLALMTLASEDARHLREEIAGKAVLHVLCAATMPLSVPAIAEHLSKDLGLPASLQASLIESALANLQAGSLVEPVSNQQWGITEAGLAQVASLSTEAATDILAGANVVRSTLETLTGYKLHESQFSLLWSTLLDYWSQLFHTNGLSVISAINDFTSGHAGASVHLESLVSTGAARIKSIFAIPEMGDAIAQAVFDILTERTGPAFDWLSKVCERFVALCSLGLEASSTEELRRVIAHYTLVLDSDVVITAMCQGERGHHATRELLGKWTRLGGRLMVPVPVLEEVAYHAYVSQRDFQETKELAPGLNGLDLIRYCSNAFVRAFYTVEKNPQHWANFRAMYAGEKPHDYSKILDILRDQMVVEFMQANCDPDLSASIKRYLLTISSSRSRRHQTSLVIRAGLAETGSFLPQSPEHEKASGRQAPRSGWCC